MQEAKQEFSNSWVNDANGLQPLTSFDLKSKSLLLNRESFKKEQYPQSMNQISYQHPN